MNDHGTSKEEHVQCKVQSIFFFVCALEGSLIGCLGENDVKYF